MEFDHVMIAVPGIVPLTILTTLLAVAVTDNDSANKSCGSKLRCIE